MTWIDFGENIEYLLAFIPAILGLSVPVMLQVIERVDSRYGSTRLTERLKTEGAFRFCNVMLIVALVTCVYNVFFRFPSPCDCCVMNNSANLIAAVGCVVLIASFLYACKVVLVYYSPAKLQDRILGSYSKARSKKKKERDFADWVDLTKSILNSSDWKSAMKVYDTIGKEISSVFIDAPVEGAVFPEYLVSGITGVNENLCQATRRPFTVNNGNQMLKDLISDPLKMSDDTYRLLWRNLQVQLFYDQEDWVYEYWTAAVEVYCYQLSRLHAGDSSLDDTSVPISADDVRSRETQRCRFKEFHLTLCAAVLYEKRYDLLDSLMSCYLAKSPEYEYPLVPSSMIEIQEAFRVISNSSRFSSAAEKYYPMRGLKGIVDDIILGSVNRYLTLLYVRLFSNIGRMKRLDVAYPNTLGELGRLNEQIEVIERLLPTIIGNKDLMSALSFNDFEAEKAEMKSVIEGIKNDIKQKKGELVKNKPNSEDIVTENLKEVKGLIENGLRYYDSFKRGAANTINVKGFSLRGESVCLFPNEAFQEDAGVSYANMAEYVSERCLSQVQQGFASAFYLNAKKALRVASEDIFKAIDHLEISNGYVIVSFDVYWEYYKTRGFKGIRKIEIDNKVEYEYNGVSIICLHGGVSRLVPQTLFVMKKEDLPSLSYDTISDEVISKYNLTELNSEYKLYGSIVKLADNQELQKIANNMSKEEALRHSLFGVFVRPKVSWSKGASILSIKLMYTLKDNGTTDALDSIKPFDELFPDKV